jgi:hypothetical protein
LRLLADPSNRTRAPAERKFSSAVVERSGQNADAHKLTSLGLTAMKQLADRPGAPPSDFNSYAISLLTCEPESMRNPQTALSYAERAVELTKSADPILLDTLALAPRTGDAARAVSTAEKALSLLPAGGGPAASRTRKIIESHLAEFR